MFKGVAGDIILIRHGQTSWNKTRYIGSVDIPLDSVGRSQAMDVASKLEGHNINAIYSSPLKRAIETITPLAKRIGISVKHSDHLKEMDLGCIEGRLRSEHKIKIRKEYLYQAIPGGESLFDVYERSQMFMRNLQDEFLAGNNLVVVGHYRSNKMVLGSIYGESFEDAVKRKDYRPENGSIYQILYSRNANGKIDIQSARFI